MIELADLLGQTHALQQCVNLVAHGRRTRMRVTLPAMSRRCDPSRQGV
jgi:hypothetical protein